MDGPVALASTNSVYFIRKVRITAMDLIWVDSNQGSCSEC